ncbi:Uncharacterized protein ChrSV_4253 [Chromobacterium vaccinii]|nr:Uncharacterized protein ChrSW_4253 [Chromobacterium vaccinii]QND91710.1 Uncharacterized protein ChrSV_4253 [Chromobacterium vaccinii]
MPANETLHFNGNGQSCQRCGRQMPIGGNAPRIKSSRLTMDDMQMTNK